MGTTFVSAQKPKSKVKPKPEATPKATPEADEKKIKELGFAAINMCSLKK